MMMDQVFEVAKACVPGAYSVAVLFLGYWLGRRRADAENIKDREADLLEQAKIAERRAAVQQQAKIVSDVSIRGD